MKHYTKAAFAALFLCAFFSCAQASAAAAADSFVFNYDMKPGSSGTNVAALQAILISRGYHIASIESGAAQKGYFGSQTKLAATAFQTAQNLPATGYVGSLTRAKLNALSLIVGDKDYHVVSPNGGEVWQAGSVHALTWNRSTLPQIDIADSARYDLYLMNAPSAADCTPPLCRIPNTEQHQFVLDFKVASNETYNWIVGTAKGGVNISSGNYIFQVCLAGTATCDSSDSYFTITAASSTNVQTSITTVAPNGGEKWPAGSVQTIQWNFSRGTDDRQSYAVDIRVDSAIEQVQCPAGYSCTPAYSAHEIIAQNIPAEQQKYIWTVGSKMSTREFFQGSYKISICFTGTNNCAVSDKAFDVWPAKVSQSN
jgi:peptidoglycan hydrolase-like protein with peptidoglycan-binding domain